MNKATVGDLDYGEFFYAKVDGKDVHLRRALKKEEVWTFEWKCYSSDSEENKAVCLDANNKGYLLLNSTVIERTTSSFHTSRELISTLNEAELEVDDSGKGYHLNENRAIFPTGDSFPKTVLESLEVGEFFYAHIKGIRTLLLRIEENENSPVIELVSLDSGEDVPNIMCLSKEGKVYYLRIGTEVERTNDSFPVDESPEEELPEVIRRVTVTQNGAFATVELDLSFFFEKLRKERIKIIKETKSRGYEPNTVVVSKVLFNALIKIEYADALHTRGLLDYVTYNKKTGKYYIYDDVLLLPDLLMQLDGRYTDFQFLLLPEDMIK